MHSTNPPRGNADSTALADVRGRNITGGRIDRGGRTRDGEELMQHLEVVGVQWKAFKRGKKWKR